MCANKKVSKRTKNLYLVFKNLSKDEFRSGDDSKVDTPVPISNTEVKHFNGEGNMA